MTTLKDYKEKVLKSFEEKFNRIVPHQGGFIVGKKSGKYDNYAFALEDIESFLSLAIDNAIAEAFKAVEVEKAHNVSFPLTEFEEKKHLLLFGFNNALEVIEDRKKQYLV